MIPEPDPRTFREVLGQYPTGVVVVTSLAPSGEPVGMTVGSFTSVSLDPPLVAFLPSRASSSWRALREAGDTFCVNVLGAGQEHVCRAVATRKQDKFAGIPWHASRHGNPVIADAVAYIDCAVEAVHEAGDHHIVIGRVRELDTQNTAYPLLFFRGGYGSFVPRSLAAGDADLLEQLRLVDLARPDMDRLAARFDTEVTAVTLVRDDLVLAAASGRTRSAATPTRVGHRVPFLPPLGSVYAAWGGEELKERWIANLDPALPASYSGVPGRVRERGYSITFGHAPSAHLESVAARLRRGDPAVTEVALRDAIRDLAGSYNPESIDTREPCEFRSMAAPVFAPDGRIAFALTLWGPAEKADGARVREYTDALLESASAATRVIRDSAAGLVPDASGARTAADRRPPTADREAGADMNLSVVVGNPRPGSRTLAVARRVAEAIAPDRAGDAFVIDLAEHAGAVFDGSSEEMRRLTGTVARSDLVVVASPTYKAAYTGLLKAFLDRYPDRGLAGVCAIPVMTGGSPHHSLAPEMTLRPLLSELGATIPCRSLYVDMQRIDELGAVVEEWAAPHRAAISAVLTAR